MADRQILAKNFSDHSQFTRTKRRSFMKYVKALRQ
jgi:hypothetical protein